MNSLLPSLPPPPETVGSTGIVGQWTRSKAISTLEDHRPKPQMPSISRPNG